MEVGYCTNMAGRRFLIPEQPLESSDCREPEPEPSPACQCSKCEQDIWPGEYTFGGGMGVNLCKECFDELLRKEIKMNEIAEALGFDVTLQ